MRKLLLYIFLCLPLAASAQSRQQRSDTIPFEIVQDKFIFEANIDGRHTRLILDTGGKTILVSDSAKTFETEFVRGTSIADVNNARIDTYVGKVKDFRIGKFWGWGVKEVTVIPNQPFYRELGVSGIVGGDMFKEACLTIDRRGRRFIISYPYRPAGIARTAGVAMQPGAEVAYPVVPVKFGDQTVNVLFDSGASGFLSLSARDYAKLGAGATVQERGHGMLYVGAAGIAGAVTDSIMKVHVAAMTLPGGKVLENVGTLVGNHPATIVGQQLFDLGMVMLDYPRGLLYFLPYNEATSGGSGAVSAASPLDVSGLTTVWNVRILPVVEGTEGLFRVMAVLGDAGVEVGERVWSIGGIPLTVDRLSESAVLEALAGRSDAEIVVGDNKRTVTIKKI